jgi:peptidyl-tRNA hydrolase, PTH2 family
MIDPATLKQVLVIRRDLKMRRGKEIAQGSHASMAFLVEAVVSAGGGELALDDVAMAWMTTSNRKVTLQARSEEELVELHTNALAAGLRSHLITDSGRTEFGGVPTVTALAIGPDIADAIDKITGHLTIY